jgi:hypothetical protein
MKYDGTYKKSYSGQEGQKLQEAIVLKEFFGIWQLYIYFALSPGSIQHDLHLTPYLMIIIIHKLQSIFMCLYKSDGQSLRPSANIPENNFSTTRHGTAYLFSSCGLLLRWFG